MPDFVNAQAVDEVFLEMKRRPVIAPPPALLVEMNRDNCTGVEAAQKRQPAVANFLMDCSVRLRR